jgi:hypothetical protein
MASVGASIVGSGTDSTRTSRLPCQVKAFIDQSLSISISRATAGAFSNGGTRIDRIRQLETAARRTRPSRVRSERAMSIDGRVVPWWTR